MNDETRIREWLAKNGRDPESEEDANAIVEDLGRLVDEIAAGRRGLPATYKAIPIKGSVALAMTAENIILTGFPSERAVHEWLLTYFDNNATRNARIAYEIAQAKREEERIARLRAAALLEVDPNGKPS